MNRESVYIRSIGILSNILWMHHCLLLSSIIMQRKFKREKIQRGKVKRGKFKRGKVKREKFKRGNVLNLLWNMLIIALSIFIVDSHSFTNCLSKEKLGILWTSVKDSFNFICTESIITISLLEIQYKWTMSSR